MESRKMVLMNLFSEQQWICRHRKQTYRLGWGKAVGGINGESDMEADTLPCVK